MFLRLCISIADYSSCVDITAPEFWQYLKNCTTFEMKFSLVIFMVCIYNYMYIGLKPTVVLIT